jgi:hypothetical protein
MNDLSMAYVLGVNLAVRDARSALPNAPTLPDPRRTPRTHSRTRIALAGWLHSVADRVSPSAVPIQLASDSPTPC